jgi:hypothetical protein
MAQDKDKEFLGSQVVRTPVFHPRRPPVREQCAWPVAPGCVRLGDCARGFCARHFLQFRAQCIANHAWGHKEDREEFLRLFLHPQPTPWEYTNDQGEAELIALAEEQERFLEQARNPPAEPADPPEQNAVPEQNGEGLEWP